MKPGYGLFFAALLWLFLGAAGFFSAPLSLIWFLAGLCVLPLIIADALVLTLLSCRFEVRREIAESLALGETVPVTLRIQKSGPGLVPAALRVFDLYPDGMECRAFPLTPDRGLLKKGGVLVCTYPLRPLERGPWEFSGPELLLSSPLRFWQLKRTQGCVSRGRTYPNFRKLANRTGTADLRGIPERSGPTPRKRGQGLEFQSLREYQPGDSVKAIDWRATGRRGKVIIREYQEEQDQQVLFLLDSGYRLHRREGEFIRGAAPEAPRLQFDSALEAALLLAYTALKHGDAVAAGTFGHEERWIPPHKGMSTLTELMNGLYDLKSAPVPSSPFSALENALARLNRRTFIILLSNFREEDGESLSWILPRIERRHLLLLVSLRELEAEALALRHPANKEEALETAAAFAYLASRRRLYKSWEHSGLLTLETSPADISAALINRYLQIKRSGRL
ncbi:MAG: DUF58 domain-containing protein [Treponema sp.]|jgi:uncharacterized protein (DUF58 family)|nr:DUF58 domain-containing protein [Treponema sp.]